jgi:hypothetical protein
MSKVIVSYRLTFSALEPSEWVFADAFFASEAKAKKWCRNRKRTPGLEFIIHKANGVSKSYKPETSSV